MPAQRFYADDWVIQGIQGLQEGLGTECSFGGLRLHDSSLTRPDVIDREEKVGEAAVLMPTPRYLARPPARQSRTTTEGRELCSALSRAHAEGSSERGRAGRPRCPCEGLSISVVELPCKNTLYCNIISVWRASGLGNRKESKGRASKWAGEVVSPRRPGTPGSPRWT